MYFSGVTSATSQLITSYTDQLLKDGLVTRILDLLDRFSVSDELVRLEKGRAVGDGNHRRRLVEMLEDQRTCLADCLFLWTVQTPLGKDHTLEIIGHVKKMKMEGERPDKTRDGDGGQSSTVVPAEVGTVTVDVVTVSLCMTVMACFNIGEESVDQSDDSLLSDDYPLLSDSSFLPAVHAELNNVR